MSSISSVAKLYAGRSVFITGGAGFVGKSTIEKLLRSCPSIERIYVLIRPKKNETIQQRLEQTAKQPVFERLSREQPNFMRKIVGVSGDLLQPGLGISDADHSRISANTSIVMHIAAAVKFLEPISVTVGANVLGTRNAIQLAHSLKNPEAFVHVSTAYSNADKRVIEEKIYETPIEPEKLISLVNTLNSEQLEMITPSLLGAFPYLYHYTKGIAEKLVENEIGSIPCAILRPSVITPTIKEPFEGWVDNITGFNGLMSGVGLGLLAYIKCTNVKDTKFDLLPVDLTANAVIAAGWDLIANKHLKQDPSKVTVYNFTTGDVSPITIHECGGYAAIFANQYPLSNKIRKTSRFLHVWNDRYWFYRKFDQSIELPLRCYVADTISKIKGKKPKATKTMHLYNKLREVLGFFTSTEWDWKTDNIAQLEKSLSPHDKKTFSLNREIAWNKYLLTSWLGVKKFILKDPLDLTIPADRENTSFSPSSGELK